jgi:VanZ family protein
MRNFDALVLFRGSLTGRTAETLLRVVPVAIYLTLIWVVSGIPGESISSPVNDKVAHFFEYFALALLLMIAAGGFSRGEPRLHHYAASWLFAAAWGGADEFHQSFVPGRDSSFGDFAADVAGATTALLLLRIALGRSRR